MNENSLSMLDHRDVPIFLNVFNRRSPLERLLTWLQNAGYRNLIIVDNASKFAPLVEYLQSIEGIPGIRIARLPYNMGHLALWKAGLLATFAVETEFVYTDGDVIPIPQCSLDIVRQMQHVLNSNPSINKVGVGLRIDDLPRTYAARDTVIAWESQFWRKPAGLGLFDAPVDTTFALYRPHAAQTLARSVRFGWPNLAMHDAWYSDSANPTAEESFYRAEALEGVSNWSVADAPDWLLKAAAALDAPRLVQFGCWARAMPAFTDGNNHRGVSPIFDGAYIEHVGRFDVLPERIATITKIGGRCIVRSRKHPDFDAELDLWERSGWEPIEVRRVVSTGAFAEPVIESAAPESIAYFTRTDRSNLTRPATISVRERVDMNVDFRSIELPSVDPAVWDRFYGASAEGDPYGYLASAFERRKYATQLAMIEGRQYENALEL